MMMEQRPASPMPNPFQTASRIAAQSGLRMAHQVRSGAVSLLFPPVCACCSKVLCADASGDGQAPMPNCCDECIAALAKPYNACPCCASRDPGTASDGRCFACRDRRFQFRWAVALGPYEGVLREAVLRTKKPAEHGLTAALTELLWQRCGPRLVEIRPDAVAAVPMHWWHRLRRGGNGPDIVSELLSRRLRAASLPNLLSRRRNNDGS